MTILYHPLRHSPANWIYHIPEGFQSPPPASVKTGYCHPRKSWWQHVLKGITSCPNSKATLALTSGNRIQKCLIFLMSMTLLWDHYQWVLQMESGSFSGQVCLSGTSLLWISITMPTSTHAAWSRLLLSHCSQIPHMESVQSHYPTS